MNAQLLRAPLVAACTLLFVLLVAPAAQATDASVTPVEVLDNPKCVDFGLAAITKFDPVESGTKDGITLTKHDGLYVKWTSTVAVDWVIVKGGPNANIYKHPTDTFGDDWLHAPINEAENDPERGKPYGLSHVEFCTDGTPEPRTPAIDVEKVAVATPIAAGDVARFTFEVTNIGTVELSDYVFSDPICDGGNATQTSGDSDSTLGVGEVRTYSCSVDTAESDTAAVGNTVCVEGMDAGGKVGENEVGDCDSATVELTPTPTTTTPTTTTTPATTTPATTTPAATTPVATTPASGTLAETISSGRARLRGPSGCVDQAFRASVTGRSIASVRFYVDGKLVKKLTGERASYSVKVNPRKLGVGRHRVVARVRFDAASATPGRTLPLTFRRCAQQIVPPRFTG